MKRIAEYKRYSPWDGTVTNRDLADVVTAYHRDPAIWGISLVVDERWHGALDDIEAARKVTNKPILAKGLDLCVPEVVERGATFALTYSIEVASAHKTKAWLEVHEIQQLPQLSTYPYYPYIIVANNRDVRTGEIVFGRAKEILSHVRRKQTLSFVCAASGYQHWGEIPASFDFGIMGSALLR